MILYFYAYSGTLDVNETVVKELANRNPLFKVGRSDQSYGIEYNGKFFIPFHDHYENIYVDDLAGLTWEQWMSETAGWPECIHEAEWIGVFKDQTMFEITAVTNMKEQIRVNELLQPIINKTYDFIVNFKG